MRNPRMFGKYNWNSISHRISSPARATSHSLNNAPAAEVATPPSSPSHLPAPVQSPLTPRRASSTASRGPLSHKRGFHQDPQKPWQYYLDSGRRELLEIMNRENLEHMTFSSQSSSSSSSSSGKPSLVYNSANQLQETLEALSKRSSPFSDPESDDDEMLLDYFLCPEGISRVPFSDLGFNQQKSARLSSIYQGQSYQMKSAKRSPQYLTSPSASSSFSSPSEMPTRPSEIRSQYRNGSKVEYSPTPTNSPLIHH